MRLSFGRIACTLALLLLGAAACDGLDPDRALLEPEISSPRFETSEAEEDGELAKESGYTGPTRAAAWIGSSGGSLSLAGHSLVVPEGAVQNSLCFTMELGPSDVIDVDLNAWKMDSSESCKVEGDGGEGWEGTLWEGNFEVPVTLGLTYSRANNVTDPADLVVAWLKSATETVPVSSWVDTAAETVNGELDHFSAYAAFIP